MNRNEHETRKQFQSGMDVANFLGHPKYQTETVISKKGIWTISRGIDLQKSTQNFVIFYNQILIWGFNNLEEPFYGDQNSDLNNTTILEKNLQLYLQLANRINAYKLFKELRNPDRIYFNYCQDQMTRNLGLHEIGEQMHELIKNYKYDGLNLMNITYQPFKNSN